LYWFLIWSHLVQHPDVWREWLEAQTMSTDALGEAILQCGIEAGELTADGKSGGSMLGDMWAARIAALADPASETTREYKHWPWCNGDRRIPAGEPGNSCCCFNDYAGRLAGAASETEKLPAKWRSEEWCASTMTDDRPAEEICASELEAALKADRQGG
jgi:hypothetical protein